MCGIIGCYSTRVDDGVIETLKKLMIESSIRGKHASGVSWYDGNKIQSIVKSVPINELVNTLPFDKFVYNGCISLIAHARYSTSSIKWNQPLIGEHIAIAHNGVITQTDPQHWKSEYGYDCKTENDSELLLRAIEHGDKIYEVFPDSSVSVVVLSNSGIVDAYRNDYRPLWEGEIQSGYVYASTQDILRRSGISNIQKVPTAGYEDLQNRSKYE